MKKSSFIGVLLVLAAATMFMGCQPKEVTSAKVYIQQNDWDKALEQLQKAVELYPENPEAWYLLGEAYGEKGKFAEMIEAFEKSIAVDPKFEPQIKQTREKFWVKSYNAGVNGFNKQDMDVAMKGFKEATILMPDRADAYRNLAVAYANKDMIDEAIATLKKAIEIDPEDVGTMVNLGTIYYQAGKFEEAIDVFNKALEKDPSNGQAIKVLAFAYDQIGQSEKALEAYDKALQQDPDNIDLIFNYGRLFYNKEDYANAIKWFEKVLEQNPDDYQAALSVGDAYLRIADEYRNKANDLDSNNGNIKEIESLRKQAKDNYLKAIPMLERAAELNPDESSIWHNLGVAYINAGQPEKGKEAFDKAEALK